MELMSYLNCLKKCRDSAEASTKTCFVVLTCQMLRILAWFQAEIGYLDFGSWVASTGEDQDLKKNLEFGLQNRLSIN